MYYSCQMVVLLSVKYLNFIADDKIILLFLHLVYVGFLVLPILSACSARVEWVYFSASSICSSLWMTRLFCFFTVGFSTFFLYFLY
jgi:hypothetical protein